MKINLVSVTNRGLKEKLNSKNLDNELRAVSRQKIGGSINFAHSRYSMKHSRMPTQPRKRLTRKVLDVSEIKVKSAIRTHLLNNKGKNGVKEYAWNSYRGNK